MNQEDTLKGINKRLEIKDFIIQYMKEYGYGPSYREIGNGVGLKSNSSVNRHIHKMLEMGMLETDAIDGAPRALRVPGYKFVKDGKK